MNVLVKKIVAAIAIVVISDKIRKWSKK